MATAMRTRAAILKVTVDGNPLSTDLEPLLLGAWMDDDVRLPGSFLLEFRDIRRDVLSRAGFRIGSEVVLRVITNEDLGGKTLFQGEATAFEAEFDVTGARLYVRGYDKSHRLRHGSRTTTYRNVTATDVVRQVAQRSGIRVGSVDATSTVYDQLTQAACSDWDFLNSLAHRERRVLSMTGAGLCFSKATEPSSGPGPASSGNATALQLSPTTNLLRLRIGVTAAEQVSTVQVRGWDYQRKQAVVGQTAPLTPAASIGTDPGQIASSFGSSTITGVHTPYPNQAEADLGASALAQTVGSTFASLEGVAVGSPLLRAGTAVSVSALGQPFDGKWVLTATRHRFNADDGYTVSFTVTGGPDTSTAAPCSPPARSVGQGPSRPGRFYGVAVGQVTDVKDPQDLARVKVRFPWLAEDHESDWVRLALAGAGAHRGLVVLPEVDDEVLVAFEHGDVEHPVVIGSLYNGVDKPPLGSGLIDSSSSAVNRRGFVSRTGGSLIFFDGDGDEGIGLLSGDKSLRLSLNQSATTIKISSGGKVEITGSDQITVKSNSSLHLEAQDSLHIKAGSSLELHGSQVKVSADGNVQVSGNPIQLN
jgi:phage protein D